MKAPDFSLVDQYEKTHSLQDYAGKWVILYFYPKDDTPGCTKEACSFRDVWVEFEKKGLIVLGISADSVKSHQQFAEKYHLTFPILSDTTKETIKAYNAFEIKKVLGKEFEGIIRKTFIISPEGEIVKEYPKVTPDKHAEQILADIAKLK